MSSENNNPEAVIPFTDDSEFITVGSICPIREGESDHAIDYGLVYRVDDDEEKIAQIALASLGIVRHTTADVHIKSDRAGNNNEFTIHPSLVASVFFKQIGDPIGDPPLIITQEQMDKVHEGGPSGSVSAPESSEEQVLVLLSRVQRLGTEVLDYFLDDEDEED